MPQHDTILLVEDDSDLRTALETAFRRAGYRVVATGDGLRAVELAREHPPAAAVVGLLLPGQSGFLVTLALKAEYGDAVRVAVTSAPSPALADYALAVGAERFLAKPFAAADVVSAVTELAAPVQRPRARIGA